ncbi:hypothetical protein Lser_V15G29035 [Lactuca serriola]
MFKTFFTVASDEHHETVITAMETIMAVLLEESEEIGEDLLSIILSTLGRDNNFSNPQIDYHEVIYDIYRCAPQALSKIVPNLKRELLIDKIDRRLKAVKVVGDLFSFKGSSIPQTFHPFFLEFLMKFNYKVVEVRMSVVEYAKLCLLYDPLRTEAPQLLGMNMIKVSNIMEIDPKPFDPKTFVEEGAFVVDESGHNKQIRLENNIVRYRAVRNLDGTKFYESNAQFIRWSDGSLQLQIRNEVLDISVQYAQHDQAHLFLRHEKISHCEKDMNAPILINDTPSNSKGRWHR